jgi:hypothetical protein
MSGYGASAATSTSQTQGSPFQQMISQVGSALQSGNLTAAQQALSSFQQMAASGASGHHHHRHGGGAGNATASAASTATSTASSIAVSSMGGISGIDVNV